tara:strand:- start:1110 stop:1628 length:519 start_codon:yes stop_codon:yes gene_type:complete
MKSFSDYLAESKKTYPFKIGVAGELPEGFAERLELGLKKYGLVSLSKGKRTPITKRPLDFPNLENTEVTYFETEVTYPTTVQVLTEYVATLCTVPVGHVIVRNPNDPQEIYQQEADKSPYESLLNTEELDSESAQKDVGGEHVMSLLKDLEKARKERDMDKEIDPSNAAPTS